jgi:preprotein translocase subunit SecG
MLLAVLGWSHYLFMIPLGILSVFLVLIILVQRGRGGGLTGALGGMGGQSAFGTKAGDLFTRITIVVAAIWVVLSMASLKVLNNYASTGGLSPAERGRPTTTAPKTEGGIVPSATKSGEAPAEKSTESEPAATKSSTEAEAPAAASGTAAPAAAPPTTSDADAKGAEAPKP